MNAADAIEVALSLSRDVYGLSLAEVEILRGAVDGLSQQAMSAARNVKESTIKVQAKAVCQKLGARSLQLCAVCLMRDALVLALPVEDD